MFKCIPLGESIPAQAPAWRLLRGAVQYCVQSWSKNSTPWFPLLVGIISVWNPLRTGRVLGVVLCPSCASWSHCQDSHADQRCSDVWGDMPRSSHVHTGNRHFKRLLTLIRDLQKMRDTMDFESSFLVSCLAHVTNLLSRTASSMSQLHF